MLYTAILLSVTGFVVAAIVILLSLARNVTLRLCLTLIVTIVSLTLWQVAIFAITYDTLHAAVWGVMVYLWPSVAAFSFYLFITYLSDGKGHAHHKGHIINITDGLMSVATAVQVLALVSNKILLAVHYSPGGIELLRGPFYYVYLTGLCGVFIAILVRLVASLLYNKRGRQVHRALVTVLISVTLAITYGMICNVIMPLATGSQRNIGWGVLTVDIFAIGFAWSVLRGQLLDVRLYAVRSMAYILSLITWTAGYGLLIFFVSQRLLGVTLTPAQAGLNIGAALLLGILFQPVKRFYDRVTNHFFYRGNYDMDEFYAHLSRLLASTSDLRALLHAAANEIRVTLKAEEARFVVYDQDAYVTVGTAGSHHKLPRDDVQQIAAYAADHAEQAVMTESLAREDAVRRVLVSHKIALVLPLHLGGGRTIGYLMLGEHQGSNYTLRDVRALQTVADELAIAIQNALSVHQVKELNETLQQRIDEATKELRHSNAQLQKLDEAKDEFVSMASHQLRTPLTSVKGYIDMVLEGDAGAITDMQRHLLGEAFTSSERMVHLINDFLNVSRLQTGKFMIDRRPIDLATIVAQEVDGLKTTAAQRKLSLSYKVSSNIPQLYADEGKLRQVIMNFIDNAIYYSKEGTTIKVGLSVEGPDLVLTVKDTGIGVPEAEQANLFTKFFRATNARRQRPDGTGVGLYLAKRVVVAHGGKIMFESNEGKGSMFGFSLPIKRLQSAPADNAN